jgi:hypothetical protein
VTDEHVEVKSKSQYRIALNEKTIEILHAWRSQLIDKYPGIKVSDSDLVNWMVSTSSLILSANQLSEIKDTYFDEIKQLEWMLAEAKRAKAQVVRENGDAK